MSHFSGLPVWTMFLSVLTVPRKKCSFDACWSSFPVALLWPLTCRGAFPVPVSLFPGAEDATVVWPSCWQVTPVGVRCVTVSSRILLSWKNDIFFMELQCMMVVFSDLLMCKSTSSMCFLSSSSTSSWAFSHSFFSFSCSFWYCSCRGNVIWLTSSHPERTCYTQTHWEQLHVHPEHLASMHCGSHSRQHHSTSVPVGGAPAPAANFPGVYAPHWGPRPSD